MKKLYEFQAPGTERLLSPADDLEILFRRLYPGLPFKDALYTHINKQTRDQEKKDTDQNKLINMQSNEINKLQNFVKSMDTELQDFETMSKQNDQDIERLKQLAGALKTGGEERRDTIKVSDQQLQSLRADLEALRNKPGAEPEQIRKLQAEIEKAKSGKTTSVEFEKLQKGLDALTKEPRLNPEEIEKTIADIKKGYEGIEGGLSKELEKARQDLESKERRFRKSIARNSEKLKSFGNNFKTLDDKVKEIDDSIQQYANLPKKLKGIENKLVQDFEAKLNDRIENITGTLGAVQQDLEAVSRMQWDLKTASREKEKQNQPQQPEIEFEPTDVDRTGSKIMPDLDFDKVEVPKSDIRPFVRKKKEPEPTPAPKVEPPVEPDDGSDGKPKSRFGKQSDWMQNLPKRA